MFAEKVMPIVTLVASVIAVLSSAIVLVWSWRKNRSEVDSMDAGTLKSRADAASALAEGVKSVLDPLNNRIDELEADQAVLRKRVLELTQDNGDLKQEIGLLKIENADAKHKLDVRANEIVILQRKVTERDVRINELEKQQATNVNILARMSAQVDYLRGRNALLENWADRLSDQVVKLGGQPESLEGAST